MLDLANNTRMVSLGLAGVLLVMLVVVLVALVRAIRRTSAEEEAEAAGTSSVPFVEPVSPPMATAEEEGGDWDDAEATRLKAFSAELLPKLSLDGDDDEDEDEEGTNVSEDSKPALLFEGDAELGQDEPTGPHELITTLSAGLTDKGLKRRRNEDSWLVEQELDLYAVADGMGGYAGGDIASSLAIKEVRDAIRRPKRMETKRKDYPRLGAELVAAVERANKAVWKMGKASAELAGMGTTLLTARFSRKRQRVYIAHVGDSRLYRIRDGKLRCMTTDHTLGARGVTGPLAANIRRAIGVHDVVKVDLLVDKPLPNDIYLLCSDGMYKMLNEDQIVRTVGENRSDLSRAAAALIAASNAAGGKDNITVVLIGVRGPAAMSVSAQQARA